MSGARPSLAGVQLGVGGTLQLFEVSAVTREAGDAGGRGSAIVEGLLEAPGDRGAVIGAGAGQYDRELVAADPPDRVHRPDDLVHHVHRPAKDVVTCRVPASVVDLLEVIEVEHHEPDRPARSAKHG